MEVFDHATKIEERIVNKATIANIPLGATFELLPLCNMDCKMCFIRLNKQEMDSISPIYSAKQWLDIACKLKEKGTMFVLLTGGEPFLYKEFKELYTGLKKLGMIITINTNGTLITEDIAAFLSQDKPRRINITLYGSSNETYSRICHNPKGFDQTVAGIDLCMKYNLDVKLNGTLIKENLADMQDMIQFANSRNLYLKIDTYMYPTVRNSIRQFDYDSRLTPKQSAIAQLDISKYQKHNDDYYNYLKFITNNYHTENNKTDRSIPCRAARSSLWITWDHKLNPCVFLDSPSFDLESNDLDTLWQELIHTTQSKQMPMACVTCPKHRICPVCMASIYCENKSLDDVNHYLCEYTDELYHEAKERLEEYEKD